MRGIIDPYFFFRISDGDLSDKKNRSCKNIYLTLYNFFELHPSLFPYEDVHIIIAILSPCGVSADLSCSDISVKGS